MSKSLEEEQIGEKATYITQLSTAALRILPHFKMMGFSTSKKATNIYLVETRKSRKPLIRAYKWAMIMCTVLLQASHTFNGGFSALSSFGGPNG